jgi:hypothetical protein
MERKFKKGDRITVTGQGRTARWGNIKGRVTRATKRSVFVAWDGTSFIEDQMSVDEVKLV